MTCTDGADVKYWVAVAGQHGLDSLDGVIGSANKQRYVPCGDVVRAAADRRVNDTDFLPSGLGGDCLRRARAAGGVYDQRDAGSHSRQQHALQADPLYLLVGEHADEDDVGVRAHIRQIGDGLRAEFTDSAPLLDRSAECADLVAGLDEAAHHGCTHAARPDEPDLAHRG